MRTVMVCVLVVAACGGESRSRTQAACDKVEALCGDDDDDGECPSDKELAEAEKMFGKAPIDRYMGCVEDANSCMQVIGCVGALGQGILGEVARGMGAPEMPDLASGPALATLRYERVEARSGPDNTLQVTLDIELTSDVTWGSPYVVVESRCDGVVDEEHAFFGELHDLRAGQKRSETVTLHDFRELSAPATRCELTLTFDGGAGDSERYCFEGGRTRPGGC